MHSTFNTPKTDAPKWIYASLTVIDGQRALKPAQVGPDRILFSSPPHLNNSNVEIVLGNGDAEQRHQAEVLPHDPEATRIPIRLIGKPVTSRLQD